MAAPAGALWDGLRFGVASVGSRAASTSSKPSQSCGSDKSLGFPSLPFLGFVMGNLGELGFVKPQQLDPRKPNKAACGLNEGLCLHLFSVFHFTP